MDDREFYLNKVGRKKYEDLNDDEKRYLIDYGVKSGKIKYEDLNNEARKLMDIPIKRYGENIERPELNPGVIPPVKAPQQPSFEYQAPAPVTFSTQLSEAIGSFYPADLPEPTKIEGLFAPGTISAQAKIQKTKEDRFFPVTPPDTIIESIKEGWETGGLETKSSLEWAKKMRGLDNEADEIDRYLESRTDLKENVDPNSALGGLKHTLRGAAGLAKQIVDVMGNSAQKGIIGAGLGAGMGAVGGVTALPAAVAGASLGFSIGAFEAMQNIEAGAAYKEFIQSGMEDKHARILAESVGAVNGLIESVQQKSVLGAYPGGSVLLKKAVNKNAYSLLQKFLDSNAGDLTKEVVEELTQEAVTMSAHQVGAELDPNVTSYTFGEATARMLETGKEAALSLGALKLAGAGSTKAVDMADTAIARQVQKRSEARINEAVENAYNQMMAAKQEVLAAPLEAPVSETPIVEAPLAPAAETPLAAAAPVEAPIPEAPLAPVEAIPAAENIPVQTTPKNTVFVKGLGEVEIIDNSDPSMITVRNSKGTEIKVGRASFQQRLESPMPEVLPKVSQGRPKVIQGEGKIVEGQDNLLLKLTEKTVDKIKTPEGLQNAINNVQRIIDRNPKLKQQGEKVINSLQVKLQPQAVQVGSPLSNKPTEATPTPAPSVQKPIQQKTNKTTKTYYGASGKAAYYKWGRNEYVNADLSKPDDEYTKAYAEFFERYYNAGLEGVRTIDVKADDLQYFPPFLEDIFYKAGESDRGKVKPAQPTPLKEKGPSIFRTPPQATKEPSKEETKPSKSLYEMTEEEYTKYMKDQGRTDISWRSMILNAIKRGDPVPKEIAAKAGYADKQPQTNNEITPETINKEYASLIDNNQSIYNAVKNSDKENALVEIEAQHKKIVADIMAKYATSEQRNIGILLNRFNDLVKVGPQSKKYEKIYKAFLDRTEREEKDETPIKGNTGKAEGKGDIIVSKDTPTLDQLSEELYRRASQDEKIKERIAVKENDKFAVESVVVRELKNILVDMFDEYFNAGVHQQDGFAETYNKTAEESNLKKVFEQLWQEFRKPIDSSASTFQKIANFVRFKLQQQEKFTYKQLTDFADTIFGGSIGEGKYSPKDVYDAMEMGINQHIMDQGDDYSPTGTKEKAIIKLDRLLNIVSLIPTQNKRTTEQNEFQQFSTPPPLAFLAAWAADLKKDDIVLEPSAGIGGLAIFARIAGVKEVDVNELADRRKQILEEMGFERVTQENAEHLHDILPKDIKPTVVIMNPPFSSTAGRVAGERDTRNAITHIEQALSRLQPGGRLVAIVGRGMSDEAATFLDWWEKIKKEYNVRANLSLSGINYAKYGTTFDNQLVIIDKTGPTTGKTLVNAITNLEEAFGLLEGITNERRRIQQDANESNSQELSGEGEREARPGKSVSPATNELGTKQGENTSANTRGKPGTVQKPPAGSNRVSGSRNRAGENNGNANEGGARPGQQKGNLAKSESPSEKENTSKGGSIPTGNIDRPISGETGADNRGITVEKQEAVAEIGELSDSIFTEYKPKKIKIPGAKPHPGKLVESAAMGAVDPPNPTYTPKLPRKLIESGQLSLAQLESVVYAGQAHLQVLASGFRRGFFIGDGTGVGKGREISAVILDNFNQDRKKAVWISENDKLYKSAVRDWSALDQDKNLVIQHKKIGTTESIKNDKGILFTTYSKLGQGYTVNVDALDRDRAAVKTRMEQIVEWLGADFDGIIAYDESHNMRNSISQGLEEAARKALAGIELQRLLPKARVLYVSATGATEVSNLAYAERLGLWGKGASFPDKSNFINKIASNGLTAMELICRDLKAMGVYMARSLSFDDCTYQTVEHELTQDQIDLYKTLTNGWGIVLNNLDKALNITGAGKNGRAKAKILSRFWSSQQLFFNQILISLSMPTVIKNIKEDIAKGEAVVVQLVNTNEAALKRQLANRQEGEDYNDLDSGPLEILNMFLDKSFPVYKYEEYTEVINGQTVKKSRLVKDSQGNPVVSEQAVKLKDDIMRQIGSMKIPTGVIDMLIDHFGLKNVAEITGRSTRLLLQKDKKGNLTKMPMSFTDKMKEADADAFDNDEKQILIFSDAGGTGRSYHADKTYKNQRLRNHYVLQPGWEATKAVQGLGRTNRSNQSQAPAYKLVTTNLKGHKRFLSTIARRLSQLGALTKGQRQAGGQGLFSESDNLENPIAQNALRHFYSTLAKNGYPGLPRKEVLTAMGFAKHLDDLGNLDETFPWYDVPKFLNRLLCLEPEVQNKMFDEFFKVFSQFIEQAEELGTLDKGLENHPADKISIKEQKTVYTTPEGANTVYYALECQYKNYIDGFDSIESSYTNRSDFVGYYKNTRSGNIYAVVGGYTRTDSEGKVISSYKLVGQTDSRFIKMQEFQRGSFEKVDKQEARKLWNEATKKVPEYNIVTEHMLTGTLLPIWDRLPEGTVTVARVKTIDGKLLLGRMISSDDINKTLRNLGAGKEYTKYTPAEIMQMVLDGNLVYLSNSWTIKRKLHNGEWFIQLDGNNVGSYYNELTQVGVMSMMLQNYRTMYYIPKGEAGQKAISDLVKHWPIVDIVKPSQEAVAGGSSSSNADYSFGSAAPKTVPITNRPLSKAKKIDIIKYIDKKFTVVRTGRFRMNNALGIYKLNPRVIRTKSPEDLRTSCHELGHHIDLVTTLRVTFDQGIYNAELQRLGIRTSPSKFPPNWSQLAINRYHYKEGIAEFIADYIYDKELARQEAPLFYSYFEKILDANPEIKGNLLELSGFIQEYANLSGEEKVAANIRITAEKPERESLKVTWQKAKSAVYKGMFEILSPLQEAVGRIKQGKTLSILKNPARRAAIMRGLSGKAEAWLEHGRYDEEGQKVGKGLFEILGKIMKDQETYENWITYAVSKVSLQYFPKGYEMPFTEEDAEQAIEKFETPQFLEVLEEVTAYRRALLKQAEDSGLVPRGTYKKIAETYEYNVPFYREFLKEDKANEFKTGTGQTFANLPKIKLKMKGSTRTIQNPIVSLIHDTYMYMNLSERNMVMQTLYELGKEAQGLGREIEIGIAPNVRAHTFRLEEIKQILAEAFEEAEADIDAIDLSKMATVFRAESYPGGKEAQECIVTVMINGEPKFVKLSAELYNAVLALDSQTVGAFRRILAAPVKWFRRGITFMPDFIVRNFFRDPFSALVFSEAGVNPKDWLAAVASAGGQDEWYWAWKAAGGSRSSNVDMDKAGMYSEVARMLKKASPDQKSAAYRRVTKVLGAYLEAGEAASRIAEFRKTIESSGLFTMTKKGLKVVDLNQLSASQIIALAKKNGIEGADQIHPTWLRKTLKVKAQEIIMLAAERSRDITIDFSRAGIITRELNNWVPFYNAAWQEVDKLRRAFSPKNPYAKKNLLKAVMYITLPTVLLFAHNYDDEDYWEQPQWLRDGFWLLKIPGTKKFFPIPIPFLLGYLFKTLPERLLAAQFKDDPMAKKNLVSSAIKVAIPGTNLGLPVPVPVPWLLLGMLGAKFNINTYTEIPIVPEREQDLNPEDQYGPFTSEVAKGISKGLAKVDLGISPRKIDYLISSYTGNVGKSAVFLADKLISPVTKPAPKAKDMRGIPVVSSLIRGDLSNSIDQFYQQYSDDEAEYRSYLNAIKKGEKPQLTTKQKEAIARRKSESQVAEMLSKLRKQERDIYSNRSLSPEEKAKKLQALELHMTNLVRKYLKKEPLKE